MSVSSKQELIKHLNKRHADKQNKFEAAAIELMPDYGIKPTDSDCWKQLALAFARQYAPKLKGGQPGAPIKWDAEARHQLLYDVDKLIAGSGCSIIAACKELAKHPHYRNVGTEALRRQHRNAKNRVAEVAALLASIYKISKSPKNSGK